MGKISSEVLEVLDVMKESIKLNCPEDEEELERIDKIKDYINDNSINIDDENK